MVNRVNMVMRVGVTIGELQMNDDVILGLVQIVFIVISFGMVMKDNCKNRERQ